MVSKKQGSLSVRVGQCSQIEQAVRRAVRGRGPVVALGALSLLAAAFAAPVLAADAAADSENNKSSNSSQSDDKLQQVVVTTARREAIQSADQLKKNSESIIDSVNADDAGKLPDASITEVLQRVPGVTITRYSGDADHFQAQGTGIQVRGLSGVAGRINGREVFSANGGNGLNWSDIPPELMAGVDVYKAATADLIEGGTGGQVDLRTKMPFDFHGFGAQLSGNADYADFRKKTSPTGSVLLTNTWDTEHLGRIGILVDYSYGKYASRDDFIRQDPLYKTRIGDVDRYIPGGVAYGRETFDRTRKGQYAALQWRPTDNFELSQTYWESKYQQTNTAQGVTMTSTTFAVDPNGNNVFDAAGALLKTDNLFLYNPANLGVPTSGTFGGFTTSGGYSSDTRDLSTSFKLSSSTGRWGLRGAFQAVDSTMDTLSYSVFPSIPLATSGFGVDVRKIPVVTMPSETLAGLNDPTKYSYSATMPHLAGNTADMKSYTLDYDLTISDSGFFRSLQVGARYADHTETDQTSGYDWQALGAGWNGYPPVTFAQGSPGDYSAAVFSNFFEGRVPVPANVLMPSIAMASRADVLGDHQKYGNPLKHGIQYNPWDTADVQYVDTAAYGLIRFADDHGVFGIPYRGNFGVRLVHTKQHASGFYHQVSGSYTDPATGNVVNLVEVGTPMSGGRSDTHALPSLNFMLVPNERWQTRFAYGEAMDLPQVFQIQANGELSPRTLNTAPSGATQAVNTLNGWNVSFGNPDLRPVIAHNFDLAEEWYPRPGTAVHVDAFYKRIENPLVYSSVSRPWTVQYDTGPGTVLVSYNGYHNSNEAAIVKGVEVGGHTYFESLPGALKGFGIDANYTFIDSKNPGDIYYDINGLPHNDVPLAGLSRHNFNAALLYDYKIWSARLAYSWRSEYLLSTNQNGLNFDYNYYSANSPSGTNCQSPATTTCKYIKLALPSFSGSQGQLDFGLTLRPSDHYYVTLQIANLTNTIAKNLQGGYPGGRYYREHFIADRHFNLSAGLKF